MYFENSLIVSLKKARHKRLFVLQEPLICIDDSGRRWEVPKGFPTDFASIPSFARPFIDKAHQNAYAAVLHDFLYFTQPVSRLEADSLFREALASPDCNTSPSKQWIMHRAVRLGGFRAWSKIELATEATEMADQNYIDEEDEKNAFFEWLKRLWNPIDRELDELEDDVRARATRLFRRANWPGIREREALYRKKVKKSWLFKLAYALVFLSSCITLYYWWGAMPDVTSKLLVGLGFFAANLLIPVWSRMIFWRGDTWLTPFVNLTGLLVFVSVAAASIVASAGLQGVKSDEMRSTRTQQQIEYKASVTEAKERAKRLTELRTLTNRTPEEIRAELNGLLVTEPNPQSACNSRDNYGAWSKRNCSTVSNLRVEISRAEERVRLEKATSNSDITKVAPVSSIDPQYEIVSRYVEVDRKTFNNSKPIILAILLEMVFNLLTVLLTITFGAEVREEIRERVNSQRRELISIAESDHDEEQALKRLAAQKIADEAAAVEKPLSIIEQVKETFSKEEEPAVIVGSEAEIIEAVADAPIIQTPITSPVVEETPIVEEAKEIETLQFPAGEPVEMPSDAEQRNADLEAMVLKLKWENLVANRGTAGPVRIAAEYALARLISAAGQQVPLATVWQDFSAWCSLKGRKEPDSVEDFLETLIAGLGLTSTNEKSIIILTGVTLQGV